MVAGTGQLQVELGVDQEVKCVMCAMMHLSVCTCRANYYLQRRVTVCPGRGMGACGCDGL
jgi:hypothetical protein